jgi:hypothetical protein
MPLSAVTKRGITMDAERIRSLQARLRANRSKVRTDEAARAALVLPFIQSLGYDVFDPEEVVPGFTRGQGRADFVVLDGEQHRMVISLAQDPADLTSDRAMRLAECFAVVGATTAVLTDGSLYRVHTDADQPGRMDEEPLLSVDLGGAADVDPSILAGLDKFTFDIASLATAAKSRRYEEAVRRAVGDELADPSEAFIDIVGGRMRSAGFEPRDDLFQRVSAISLFSPSAAVAEGAQAAVEIQSGDDRVMTQDEMLGYHIVRALAARHIDATRITVRPAQSYCAILLDDNNRKSIGRLHFNSQTVKYLGTFVDKKETRRQIVGPNGIYDLESFIVDRLRELDPKAFGLAETPASLSRDQQDAGPGEDDGTDVETVTAPAAQAEPAAAEPIVAETEPKAPATSFEDGIDDERREPDADTQDADTQDGDRRPGTDLLGDRQDD